MRVKKEAGVLLISGLLKLTPSPCLLSLQIHLIAIIAELQRRGPALCYRLEDKRRALSCCVWMGLSELA